MKKPPDTSLATSADYRQFVEELKSRVTSARISAARAITHEAILLYWDIGCGIVEKQREHGWGDAVVEVIAGDLQRAFPGAKGFSPQNVWRMQQLYIPHNQPDFLSQLVREMANEGKQPPNGENLSHVVREMVASVPRGHHANALPGFHLPDHPSWEDKRAIALSKQFSESRNRGVCYCWGFPVFVCFCTAGQTV